MSTSVPPRDGGAFSGPPSPVPSLLGDELALKRVFDREYSACLTSARAQLGDAESQAPRIVQTAFLNAWNQRASFSTDDQLKAFLAEQVSFGASRALSRRAAAHRFGTHGGRDEVQAASHAVSSTADAEASWNEIARTLHGEASSKDAHAAAASVGRHEAAAHMKSVAKKGQWKLPVAIGIIALAAIGGSLYFLDNLGEGEAALQAVGSATIQPIASQSGQIGSFNMADGSKVKMGPDTKVFIADGFPTKIRAVRVEGTAQFDVAPNQPTPLHVVIRKAQVIATGTSFVVSTFAPDSAFAVLVREGTVSVKAGKAEQPLAANEGILVKNGAIEKLNDAQKAELFGWVDGKVTVGTQPLRSVMEQLVRWFNLDIKIPDAALLDRPASFSVSLDSSRAAITQVEKSANVKFGYIGENKVFQDAGKAAKK
jgi:ferric-dicitrate binding protein FerR (iron transport regulator)